jgi:CDP-diacylglycerol--inositol 3-phosphatidyltransferase
MQQQLLKLDSICSRTGSALWVVLLRVLLKSPCILFNCYSTPVHCTSTGQTSKLLRSPSSTVVVLQYDTSVVNFCTDTSCSMYSVPVPKSFHGRLQQSNKTQQVLSLYSVTSFAMTTPGDVLLFVPNLIGYFRVVCTLSSFTIMLNFDNYWAIAMLLYVTSFAGDLFDGIVARKLNQTSTFGGLLDMITDRCSTLGLLYVLGVLQERLRLVYLLLIVLDISSHWCQMYSSIGSGHHKSKESNEGRNFIVRWYYQYYAFFGYLCVGAEFTYIFTYVLHYLSPESTLIFQSFTLLFSLVLPGCIMKQVVNVFQLSSACYLVAAQDAKKYSEQSQTKKK